MPGTAKSRIIQDAVGDKGCLVEGNATAYGIYNKLHENRDKTLILDDVDGIYRNPPALRLLKSLCQTDYAKTIRWTSGSTVHSNLPDSFQTVSNVCVITNDWNTLNAHAAAIVDRGFLLFFEPSSKEVHMRVGSWFFDREIYKWIGQHLNMFPQLSMRDYLKASQLKGAHMNWQEYLMADIPPKQRIFLQICADGSFTTETQRVEAFRRLTGLSRATYFNMKQRLRSSLAPDTRQLGGSTLQNTMERLHPDARAARSTNSGWLTHQSRRKAKMLLRLFLRTSLGLTPLSFSGN